MLSYAGYGNDVDEVFRVSYRIYRAPRELDFRKFQLKWSHLSFLHVRMTTRTHSWPCKYFELGALEDCVHARILVKQVLDVFTAVALAGILGRLLTRGAVIVATSNRAPWDLNKVCFESLNFSCCDCGFMC